MAKGGKYEIRRNDDGSDQRDHEKGRRSAPETQQSGCFTSEEVEEVIVKIRKGR